MSLRPSASTWRANLAAAFCLALPGAVFAQAPAEEPPPAVAVTALPEALRESASDPFAGGPSLQAHRLRGLTAEVVGLILSRPPGGEIDIEALATPLRGAGGKAEVLLFVEIEGSTFLAANQSRTARVEVYAYALGANDGVAGFLAEVFVVDVHELGEAIWQSGLKLYGHLDLPPGSYRLRVLVRHYQSGALGLRELDLEVPAFGTLKRPFVLPPLFSPPAARDAWLPIRESQPLPEYPLVVADGALSPAARPVLVAGRSARAYLFAYDLPAGPVAGRVEVQQGSEAAAGGPFEVEPRERPSGAGGFETLAISFDAPAVDPGVYSLRVQLASGAVSPPATVMILPRETRDRGLLWIDLRGRLAGVTAPQVAAAPAAVTTAEERGKKLSRREKKALEAARREKGQHVEKLADGYRKALAALGRGDRPAARAALLDLESSVLADGSVQDLQSAQTAVAKQLAGSDVESLIPVLVLHDDMYQTYRQRGLYSLGSNARERIEALAELYAGRGGSEGSGIVAARALASLGGHLQQANLPESSRRLYLRALDHDAASVAALLGLATSYERYGEYPRAVEALEQLVAAHPAFAEGLLRLAINVDRLGMRARCRELLTRTVEVEARGWVRSLAYQQLARIALATGDLDSAARLLETSLAEDPDQHGVIYLLAHVYDRRRQAHKSLELLQTLATTTGSSESARKLYDSWPEETLDAVRRELAATAQVRLGVVARVLDGAAAP